MSVQVIQHLLTMSFRRTSNNFKKNWCHFAMEGLGGERCNPKYIRFISLPLSTHDLFVVECVDKKIQIRPHFSSRCIRQISTGIRWHCWPITTFTLLLSSFHWCACLILLWNQASQHFPETDGTAKQLRATLSATSTLQTIEKNTGVCACFQRLSALLVRYELQQQSNDQH